MPLSDLWGTDDADPPCDNESRSDESSASVDSSASESSGPNNEGLAEPQVEDELARLQRRQRAEKARAASLLARRKKKLGKEYAAKSQPMADAVSRFQRTYVASREACKSWWNPLEAVSLEKDPSCTSRVLPEPCAVCFWGRLILTNSTGKKQKQGLSFHMFRV